MLGALGDYLIHLKEAKIIDTRAGSYVLRMWGEFLFAESEAVYTTKAR